MEDSRSAYILSRLLSLTSEPFGQQKRRLALAIIREELHYAKVEQATISVRIARAASTRGPEGIIGALRSQLKKL